MSNHLFPTLRGMKPDIVKTPLHNTLRKVSQSGIEVRAKLRAYPRYQYKLSFEYLLDPGAQDDDIHTLMGFYNSRGGSFDNFLLFLEFDHKVADQVFAIGDGVTTKYQLARNYGGYVEPIYGVDVGTVLITVGGFHIECNVDVGGLVTFPSPLPANSIAKWSGTFYHRVIFDEDSNDFNQIFNGVWELQTLKLISDRG